jgi:voltage-gated potassium channel
VIIEGWSAWDAFYMTIISLTTVGYREVYPLSRAGEAFTAPLLVGGVGTVLYSFTLIGVRVIEGTLHNPRERRRETQTISDGEGRLSDTSDRLTPLEAEGVTSGSARCILYTLPHPHHAQV